MDKNNLRFWEIFRSGLTPPRRMRFGDGRDYINIIVILCHASDLSFIKKGWCDVEEKEEIW